MFRIANVAVHNVTIKSKATTARILFASKRRLLSQKIDRRAIFDFLNINTFSDKEIENSYKKFVLNKSPTVILENQKNTSVIQNALTVHSNDSNLRRNVRHLLQSEDAPKGLTEDGVMSVFETSVKVAPTTSPSTTTSSSLESSTSPTPPSPPVISLEKYRSSLHALGQKLDERVWALTGSFLLTGTSIGIIIPCMPILVQQLNISHSNFGLVISAFGLAKLLGNIPAAYYVDKYGRKKAIIYGLGLCSLGIGGYSLLALPFVSDPLSFMVACRMLTGLGVSAFTAGAFMMMADVGTALNRTRTMAPAMTGFQAGIALGPALGGVAIESIGIPLTYATCGGLFALISLLNQRLLSETLIPQKSSTAVSAPTSAEKSSSSSLTQSSGVFSAFTTAFHAWRELLRDPRVVNVTALNALYWIALAGVQMTVLPLYMVSAPFNFTAGQIGSTFAMMSVCSVLSSQPVAYLADRVGKVPSIFAGSALVTVALSVMPMATDLPQLWAVTALLSVGSVVVQSVDCLYHRGHSWSAPYSCVVAAPHCW